MRRNQAFARAGVAAAIIAAPLAAGFLALAADNERPEWKISARKAKKPNPIPADAKSIAAGKTVYIKECFSCHGTTGKGDGPAAKDLKVSPGDLSHPKMWKQTDGELFWKTTEGREPMPAYEKLLTEEQRWQSVNYIRTLAPKPADGSGGEAPK